MKETLLTRLKCPKFLPDMLSWNIHDCQCVAYTVPILSRAYSRVAVDVDEIATHRVVQFALMPSAKNEKPFSGSTSDRKG